VCLYAQLSDSDCNSKDRKIFPEENEARKELKKLLGPVDKGILGEAVV